MGSGSSQLKCPKDYDYEKFNKILKLYDRIDSNGDHSVDMEELVTIANLHVKNQLNRLENMRQPISDNIDQNLNILEQQKNLDIEKLNNQFENKKKSLLQEKASKIENLENDIKQLGDISDEKKAVKFKKAITDKNGNISFWPFFNYMKTKTEDIPNIEW
tara:strand:+ start:1092 stop:1571 length:480 start_codon:yes stop_codon:yes gene_type:complete